MFGVFKQNYKIYKAFQLARNDLGIDPERMFGGAMSAEGMAWREEARRLVDSLQLNDRELAVTISAPFAPLIRDPGHMDRVEERIKMWLNLGVIRRDIAEHFLHELHHGSFDAEV